MIYVTKTFLPPQEEYQSILQRAWDNSWITNRGDLVKELELKIQDQLKSPKLIAMTNGTLPLQIAIKALGLTGDIITTPFSYVATTSSIVWEGCNPVFVDIHPEYLTIDETKIEAAITSKTTAILATHVFGNPCDVHTIDALAKKYNLKVIYDAAHCFGVKYQDKSIFEYGDVSTCSFHATKLFHTGEGGAIFCNNDQLYEQLFFHHNFGHKGRESFQGLGINGKMSELQAAMGLAVLPYIDKLIDNRKHAVSYYDTYLTKYKSITLRANCQWNYAYYPIILETEMQLLQVLKKLNKLHIFPRRYFYPSLNNLPYVSSQSSVISNDIASRILCLPLSHEITEQQQDVIIKVLVSEL